MSNTVRPEDFGKDHGLIHEAVVTGRGLNAGQSFWSGLAHDVNFFKECLKLAEKYGHTDWLQGMFVAPWVQLELAKEWNKERKWKFRDEDFASLGQAPEWPKDRLCAVVLEVNLDSFIQTVEEALDCIASRYFYNIFVGCEVDIDTNRLRLLPKILKTGRSLCWRIINLGSNVGKSPEKIRNLNSPHSAILWAAAYFPRWVLSMNGENIPHVWIPGYQLRTDDVSPWSFVPALSRHRDNDLAFQLGSAQASNKHSAVPIFLDTK